uniref:DUF7745 domain-containing protein n=1 Tax=Fagus sylvatica TaxID=28930 RepID=A0A2N9H4R1_FAGSY
MPTSWGSLVSFPLSCGFKLIVACSRLLLLFWDPTHCCFSIGEVDLVPTMEEYAELLQLDRPFSETPVIPIRGLGPTDVWRSTLGLTTAVLRPEIARPEETWRKANISLDLLTKYFSRSGLSRRSLLGTSLRARRGGRNSESMPSRSLSQGEGVPMFCTQLLQLWFCSHLRHFYRLQTPYHFERHTVSQTVNIALPFTGNSRDWASYLLDLPLGEWSWKVTWGPAVWKPWTHCALFDGVPLPGVWGCTGYYPSLALRQFGGVQYPPRLGDLDAVTFDYIPSEDMWRLLSRVEVIWEGRLSEVVLIEDGTSHSLVSRSLRVSASTGQPERVTVLERELEEAQTELLSLRLARAAEREASAARVESLRSTLHHNKSSSRFLRMLRNSWRRTWPRLGSSWRLSRRRGLEVQDELDSLRSYTQALVDPATGRPQDIVALRRALDASEEALTSARTSMGVMRVQISVLQGDNGVLQTELDLVHDALESNASWLNQEGFPVVTSLHQINPAIYYPQLTPSPAFHVTFAYGASSEVFTIPVNEISGLESARSSLLVLLPAEFVTGFSKKGSPLRPAVPPPSHIPESRGLEALSVMSISGIPFDLPHYTMVRELPAMNSCPLDALGECTDTSIPNAENAIGMALV